MKKSPANAGRNDERDGSKSQADLSSPLTPAADGGPKNFTLAGEACDTVLHDGTLRTSAEACLCRESERSAFLLDFHLKSEQLGENALYEYALDKAVSLTESRLGFLHLVSDDQRTIILTAWNREALQNCTAAYNTHYPVDSAGNWADCLRFKGPVVYNDFPHAPNQKGLPKGHTPIRRFMSASVADGSKIRIIFGVGNKVEEYVEQDLVLLQLAANELNKYIARRRAEDELRASEERNRQLIELSPNAIFLASQGSVVFANPAGVSLLGAASAEGLVGSPLLSFVHPDQREAFAAKEMEVLAKRKTCLWSEEQFVRPDGTLIDVETTMTLFVHKDAPAIQLIARDISRRKRAEAETLRLNAELEARVAQRTEQLLKFSKAIEYSPVSVIITDGVGAVQYVNPVFTKVSGYAPEEIMGRNLRLLDSGKTPKERYKELWRAILSGRSWQGEFINKAKDGREYVEEAAVAPIVNEAGDITNFVTVATDMTQRKQAEERLQRMNFAVEASSEAIFWCQPDGGIVYVNKAGVRLSGFSRKECLKLTLADLAVGWSKPYWDEHWREVKANGSASLEFMGKTKLGRLVPLEAQANYFEYQGREFDFIFIRDITKRKRADAALRQSEERYRAMIDHIFSGVTVYAVLDHGADFVVKELNSAGERILKRSKDVMLGRAMREVFPECEASGLALAIRRVWETGLPEWRPLSMDMDPDSPQWVENYVYKLPSGEIAVIFNDVTDRKRAEDQLRKAHTDLSRLMDTIPSVLIAVDSENRVIEWNDRAAALLGRSVEEAASRALRDLNLPWDEDVVERTFARCRDRQGIETLDQLRFSRPDGRQGILKVTVVPIVEDSGTALSLLVLGEDITEYVSLQSQLAHALKLESIGQLAAGIAHEINTPTQYVIGNMDFLRTSFDDLVAAAKAMRGLLNARASGEGLAEAMAAAERSVADSQLDFLLAEVPKALADSREGLDRVASIVLSMKKFAHPDVGVKRFVDVGAAIATTIAVARNEWKYAATVETDIDPDLPPILCEPGDFNQVVLNILVNAAHAVAESVGDSGEKGRIVISAKRKGEYAEIAVSDSGPGIPEEIRERIFDPFFTTKQVGRGTGQGLSIVYSIMDKHKGRIAFESEVGKGTTFRALFPFNAEQVAE